MLADRFHCYKLILIVIVTSVAVFYTSLLHIDARISAEVQQPSGLDFETPAEIFCSRLGAVLRSKNYSCDASSSINSNHRKCGRSTGRRRSAGRWIAMECRPGCSSASRTATARKSRPDQRPCWKWTPCSRCWTWRPDGRAERITTSATAPPKSSALKQTRLEFRPRSFATARSAVRPSRRRSHPSWTTIPVSAVAPICCPSSSKQKELDRLKHNRGFWLYFILRIIASGSLATTSFSMFVSFNLRVFIRNWFLKLNQRLFFGWGLIEGWMQLRLKWPRNITAIWAKSFSLASLAKPFAYV